MVNRTSPVNSTETVSDIAGIGEQYKTSAVFHKGPDAVRVDKVLLTTTAEDERLVKVKTRVTRAPELGDKFSSVF